MELPGHPRLELLSPQTSFSSAVVPPPTSAHLEQFANELVASQYAKEEGNDVFRIRLRVSEDGGFEVDHVALGQFSTKVLHIGLLSSPLRRFQVLVLTIQSVSQIEVAYIFSALPFVQSLHTLVLEDTHRRHELWKLTVVETSWLTDALFHPRARSSSWKKLVLQDCDFVGRAMGVLQEMVDSDKSSLLSVANLTISMDVGRATNKMCKQGEEDNKASVAEFQAI